VDRLLLIVQPPPAYSSRREECAAFPNGAHDDQVDAMSQALLRWNMVASEELLYLTDRVQNSPI